MFTDCRVSVTRPAFESAKELSGETAGEGGEERLAGNQGGTAGPPGDAGGRKPAITKLRATEIITPRTDTLNDKL